MARWQTLVAAAAATVLGAAALGFVLRGDDPAVQDMELVAQSTVTDTSPYSFTVQATPVEDLYPGAVRQLKLTMTNPFPFALDITDVRAELVSTSHPGCAPVPANLEVQPYTGNFPLRVPAKDSSVAGSVPLHMPNTVANDCQHTTFSIVLHADATRSAP